MKADSVESLSWVAFSAVYMVEAHRNWAWSLIFNESIVTL